MRVAALADIHGNLPALEAVLREVDAAGVDAIVLLDSPVEWFGEAFAGVQEQTVVCGHTHMPFDRLAGGRRIVNPGSVGMPYGPPGTLAYWALLGPEVRLRRTTYDLQDAAARMRRSAWPGAAEFVAENVLHGPPSDAEALGIFTSRAQERRSRSV
jgi:diadenosine tetraphosphatase ApaH/serine/threonine PP2A family protein phosphatase